MSHVPVLIGLVLLLAACSGADADPAAVPSPATSPGATGLAISDVVVPGSGELQAGGYRLTDDTLSDWIHPDVGTGAWYAFPIPGGFEALEATGGAEVMLRGDGEAVTVVTVTRVDAVGDLAEAAAAAVDRPGLTGLDVPQTIEVAGLAAMRLTVEDRRATPTVTNQITILDVGGDRLIWSVATTAAPPDDELDLVDAVVFSELKVEQLP